MYRGPISFSFSMVTRQKFAENIEDSHLYILAQNFFFFFFKRRAFEFFLSKLFSGKESRSNSHKCLLIQSSVSTNFSSFVDCWPQTNPFKCSGLLPLLCCVIDLALWFLRKFCFSYLLTTSHELCLPYHQH